VLKTQILRKYLSGLSQDQIAIELDISEGTVSAFLQESWQLDDTLMLQHEIAVVCDKCNIPTQELASNLAFSNALKKMAFEDNKIDLVLRVLNKIMVEDRSFSPEKIAALILQICNFMEANEVNLEETHKKTEEKSKQINEIKMKIIEFKKIIAKTEEAKTEALRKKRVTQGELRRFTVCKKAFEYAGIDFKNFKQITNVLSIIRQLDSNPDLIIDEMKKTSVLEFRKFCLEQDCDEREKNLQIYKKEEQDRIMYKDSYNVAVDLVNKTLVKGITDDEIISIFDSIINNKFYLSISDFIKDIDTYGGRKSAIFKMKRELEKLDSQKQGLIDSRETLGFI
jgi:hypothetical protein